MTLRYPTEINSTSGSDYVVFSAHKYRSNSGSSGRGGGIGPSVGGNVVLYMPNTTPTMKNEQNWEAKKFEGPMGVAARDIGSAVASGAVDGMGSGIGGGYGVINGFKAAAGQIQNLPDVVRQGAIQAAGQFAGTTANQIMALKSGRVFNPNIELLYEGPNIRGFEFNFSFIPKNSSEAATVAEIIKYFKVSSAPKTSGSMMYEIPHVWKIDYGGAGGTWMNKFKTSAMGSISVAYNSGLDQHATFSNGFPIRTDLQMSFQEVDVITAEDHGAFPMGY